MVNLLHVLLHITNHMSCFTTETDSEVIATVNKYSITKSGCDRIIYNKELNAEV